MAQINSKEIQKSLRDDVNARKDGTEKLKNFSDAVESASNKQKQAQLEVEKLSLSYKQQVAAGEDSTKVFMELTKKQRESNKAREELDLAKRDKENFDAKYQQESIDILNKIGNNVLKVSPEEMETRRLFKESIDIEKEQAALLRADPLRQDQADAAEANIKAKEDKEKKRSADAQTTALQKGFGMISENFKSFGESMKSKALPFLKTGLLIAAYFAFAKLLQSEALMDFIAFFGEQGGFTKTLIVLGGIITAFLAKVALKMALTKFLGGLTFIKNDLMKTNGIFRNEGGKIMGGLKKGSMGLLNGVKNLGTSFGRNATLLGGKALAGAKGLGASIMGIGPKLLLFGKGILAFVAKGLALINPVFLIGAAIAGIGVLIYKYWDEISAFFGSIGDKLMSALSDIGTKLGNFFGDLFKPVTDLFVRIQNAMAGYYNKIANSKLGKFIGMKPMATGDTGTLAGIVPNDAPDRFVTNKRNEDMQMRRKEEMMGDKRAVNQINNQTVVNNVSSGGTTVQNNATRYVKDQGSVFASNNA